MKKKAWYQYMWICVLCGILLLIAMYAGVQGFRCSRAVRNADVRLRSYEAKTAHLSYGDIAYVDRGEGTAILSVHGIFGGFDQAYDTCKDFEADTRIIAPSRFGYPGSDILGNGTPKEQVQAYVELLDVLGIDKVYVLGTSAGGTTAIRFALDYPERTAGLILYCSAMPYATEPETYAEYAGPPAFLCNDFAMYLISPLFEPIMGMSPSTITSMLPIEKRRDGVLLDASITNPDMARHFDEYRIEELKCPTLILHAKDDKLASYEAVVHTIDRFPNCTFISFDEGGHLMAGHGAEVRTAVYAFMGKRASATANNEGEVIGH